MVEKYKVTNCTCARENIISKWKLFNLHFCKCLYSTLYAVGTLFQNLTKFWKKWQKFLFLYNDNCPVIKSLLYFTNFQDSKNSHIISLCELVVFEVFKRTNKICHEPSDYGSLVKKYEHVMNLISIYQDIYWRNSFFFFLFSLAISFGNVLPSISFNM